MDVAFLRHLLLFFHNALQPVLKKVKDHLSGGTYGKGYSEIWTISKIPKNFFYGISFRMVQRGGEGGYLSSSSFPPP